MGIKVTKLKINSKLISVHSIPGFSGLVWGCLFYGIVTSASSLLISIYAFESPLTFGITC